MRIAYLECFSGISGDMFLGALVDAGVPVRVLEEAVAALAVGAALRVSRVNRSGITATKIHVIVNGEVDRPRESAHDRHDHPDAEARVPQVHAPVLGVNLGDPEARHWLPTGVPVSQPRTAAGESDPTLSQSARMGGAPSRSPEHTHTHDHGQGRHLTEIKRIIGAAKISDRAKKTAIAIFEALGAAEAKIHNTSIEQVHFHEVGAVDALVDIVGAAVGAEALGVDEIVCSALNVGGGTVKCAHGVFPVPAPATVELLKGAPVFSSGVEAELVTPTGAAIVKTLAARFAAFPAMKVERTGYGAGSRDFAGHANVARLTVGEAIRKKIAFTRGVVMNGEPREPRQPDAAHSARATEGMPEGFAVHGAVAGEPERETITVLEANLDDLNPQVAGYVMDKVLAEGALDAFGIPVQMKKNRPGTLLTVLCKPEDAVRLMHLLFEETTTLGVRRRDEQRQVLARRWEAVSTQWGEVRVKVASLNGRITNCAPEYEDCRRIAEEQHVPLKSVMLEALQAYTLGLAAKKR